MNKTIKELEELLRKYSCWTLKKHYSCIPDLAEEIFGLFKKENKAQREDLLKKIEGRIKSVKLRLEYCLKQNGLHHCKNCGLGEKDLEELEDIKKLL